MTAPPGAVTHHRELDRPAETLWSALGLTLAALLALGTAAFSSAQDYPPITQEAFERARFLEHYVFPLVPLAALAVVVWLRARTPQGRRRALIAIVVVVVSSEGLWIALRQITDPDRFGYFAVSTIPLELAGIVLLALAWGWARRRGSLWYAALVFAPGFWFVTGVVMRPFLTASAEMFHATRYAMASTVGEFLPILLTGLAAWGLDVAERR